MAHHLIASNAIKAVKSGDARRRLTDGAGLYLLLFVKRGAHGWRLDSALAAGARRGAWAPTRNGAAIKLCLDATEVIGQRQVDNY